MAESDRICRSRSGSRRREYLLDPSPPNVVVKASKKKAAKHAVGLEEAERDMAEQVARSTLERQLRVHVGMLGAKKRWMSLRPLQVLL
ncbi:unnamed protein product [Pieris brassicae]|uniref:Uncharacterized protein n=1 Tax=Pieris brassicae TaxID=7116 RepID=A0A9P0TC43_PIEBR|nr:unnamed protein product [Pieris brassicae]